MRRSWDGGDWVEVHDLNGAAQGGPILIEINRDLKHGAPLSALVTARANTANVNAPYRAFDWAAGAGRRAMRDRFLCASIGI